MGSFIAVMQYLHDAAHGVEGGCFLMKVFCEAGCVAIVSECSFVLLTRVANHLPENLNRKINLGG